MSASAKSEGVLLPLELLPLEVLPLEWLPLPMAVRQERPQPVRAAPGAAGLVTTGETALHTTVATVMEPLAGGRP